MVPSADGSGDGAGSVAGLGDIEPALVPVGEGVEIDRGGVTAAGAGAGAGLVTSFVTTGVGCALLVVGRSVLWQI